MQGLANAWDAVQREFESERTRGERAGREQSARDLVPCARRLRQYEDESEWAGALTDGLALAAAAGAVFAVKAGKVELLGARGLQLEGFEPVALPAAFRAAVDSREPVIALAAASEVGERLASGEAARVHIVPITNGERVAALLFARDAAETDANALELLAGIASMALEARGKHGAQGTIAIASAAARVEQPEKKRGDAPAWAELKDDERAIHVRAQRFARVRVAEMELSRPEACRAGREQRNLYVFLKSEIDRARERYREQFVTTFSMVDYLHLELVRAAGGEEDALGDDYPGPMA